MYPQFNPFNKPKSAARLAAEEAFSAFGGERISRPEVPPPVVKVVTRKIPIRAPEIPLPQAIPGAATAAAAAAANEAQAEAGKAPRTFLVNAKDGDEAAPTALDSQPPTLAGSAAPLRSGPRRKRQRAAPVQVIYRAEPRPPRPAATGQNALALDGLLAELDPVFTQIQAAMAFRVDDPESARQWEPLASALDEIAARIRAEMPA